MSTRQNKKRKGRSNVMNRERTVTTLTEGPESAFLVPTPTEEPAGNLLSSPFSVASSAGGANISPAAFQMPNNFGPFPYNAPYMPPMPAPAFGPQHQPQQFFHPSQGPPPGQNDLVVLERLKETIKNGQHEFFRAVPRPDVLANLYHGPRSFHAQVPPHPDQAPPDHQQVRHDTSATHSDIPAGNSSTNGSTGITPELGRLLGSQNSDTLDGSRKPLSRITVSDSQKDINTAMQSPGSAALSTPYTGTRHDSNLGPSPSVQSNDMPTKASEDNPSGHGAPPLNADSSQHTTGSEMKEAASASDPSTYRRYEPQNISRTQSEKSIKKEPPTPEQRPSILSNPKYDGEDNARLSKDSSWTHRNGMEDKQRPDPERPVPQNGRPGDSRSSNGNNNDSRGPGPSPRFYDREKDREGDRGRDRDRDREWERDRSRDQRPDYARLRDERRPDDRARILDNRRPPPEQRHYESRWADAPRRHDPKMPIDTSTGASRLNLQDDRNPAVPRPTRTLGEERSINRGPPDAATRILSDGRRPPIPPSVDDRIVRPSADDRRALPPTSDRQGRDMDDRRHPTSPVSADRSIRPPDDRRLPVPPLATDRQIRPASDDRRPPVPPPMTSERQMRPPDDRRPPPSSPVSGDRQTRQGDDRRPPATSSTVIMERQVRTNDDRPSALPPSASTDRQVRQPPDERRPPGPTSAERTSRPSADDRRPPPPPSENRITRPGPGDTLSRLPNEERGVRQNASQEDSKPRPSTSLEERLSRPAPSLQERLATSSSRPDDRLSHHPPHRPEDRFSRPVPSLEERLSHVPSSVDGRGTRPPADDHHSRPPVVPASSAASERSARPAGDDRNILLAEPARPSLTGPVDRIDRSDERGRPAVSNRFPPPPPPATGGVERGPPVRTSGFSSAPRPPSVVRDSPRSNLKPRSRSRSQARTDLRELRPSGAPPRDRSELRPPSYRHDTDRYASDRRSDMMDVDLVPNRFSAPYRRPPSPAVTDTVDPYGSRARSWAPNETYTDETARRPPVDAHGYAREWPDEDRRYPEDWETRNGRTWERPAREYERERFVEREPPNNGWETREERERRVSSFPPSVEPPASIAPRTFEQRPLSSRLTDGYTGDDSRYPRDLERARYPPVDATPSSFSRVRPRSPTPPRRPDDLRPPVKRPREDGYASSFYPRSPTPGEPPRSLPPAAEYPPRLRTPPISSSYYDDPRGPAGPPYRSSPSASGLPRERDYVDPRNGAPDVGTYPPYERREPASRIPPRSPPYSARYGGRDDRRYNLPPR